MVRIPMWSRRLSFQSGTGSTEVLVHFVKDKSGKIAFGQARPARIIKVIKKAENRVSL